MDKKTGGSHEALLQAANDAALLLLTVNDLNAVNAVLHRALEIIGQAVDADRVNLWHDKEPDGETILELTDSWLSEQGKNEPEILIEVKSPFEEYHNWIENFKNGKLFGGPVAEFKPDEQLFFSTFHTKTVYFIPLFCAEKFWGMVSIDYCVDDHTYSEGEVLTLKSICLMMASVINYQKTTLDLISINEQANSANQVKNAFLSNMSHEVRTPLNAIVGMATVGLQTEDISEKDHSLSMICDASSHLLDIISNVLDMARIEEGKLELVPEEFIFREILDKVMAVIRPLAIEKNQTIRVYVDDAIPRYVVGDDLRIRQLITNLMSNAVKFTPIFGKICLDITLKNEGDSHLELQLVVNDNGIGISDDMRDKLFLAFEQAQGALNRDYGGTGLGLPISKRIVELMDGSIKIESEPGKGTTVIIAIQLAKSRINDELLHESKTSGADASLFEPDEFKGKRLLIAEDIEINREILIALLKDTGLIIECAEDGQVAVNMVMFNIEKYDIVFMDLQMPNMGGLEATKCIRELPERKRGRLPIVAMTANVMQEDIAACIEAGMDDHLGKPLEIDKVIAVLRRYLCV